MTVLFLIYSASEVCIMNCPICNNITYEDSKLIIPESIDGPAEYLEYTTCSECGWTDLPEVTEYIPF